MDRPLHSPRTRCATRDHPSGYATSEVTGSGQPVVAPLRDGGLCITHGEQLRPIGRRSWRNSESERSIGRSIARRQYRRSRRTAIRSLRRFWRVSHLVGANAASMFVSAQCQRRPCAYADQAPRAPCKRRVVRRRLVAARAMAFHSRGLPTVRSTPRPRPPRQRTEMHSLAILRRSP